MLPGGQWRRPGPIFQSRALGRWPEQGSGVWSEALFEACLVQDETGYPKDAETIPQIGCDTSTGKGDDYCSIHARFGTVSIHHESANTMDPVRIFGRLKEVADKMAEIANKIRPPQMVKMEAQRVRIVIDDDGTGNAICSFLRKDEYNVVAIGAGTKPNKITLYPRMRDELWFQSAEKAKACLVCLKRIDEVALRRLKQQLLAVTWDMDKAGRRQVEKKDKTKEKIGRSPDDADAFNLAYYSAPVFLASEAGVEIERTDRWKAPGDMLESNQHRRGLFGL